MTNDFENFLRDAIAQSAANPNRPIVAESTMPASDAEIQLAEQQLGVALPDSYKHFVKHCTFALWCEEVIGPPEYLYPFDDCGEMSGFIALVFNVECIGDHIAINPADSEVAGERPVYYCGHDPFGYALIAASFEDWCRKTFDAYQTRRNIYRPLHNFVDVEYASTRAASTRRWWQFWKG